MDDWVYDVYDSVTARTLRRWAQQFRNDGLQGLINRHGLRSERSYDSYFGPGSVLRTIALHYLTDHPDCTSTELWTSSPSTSTRTSCPTGARCSAS